MVTWAQYRLISVEPYGITVAPETVPCGNTEGRPRFLQVQKRTRKMKKLTALDAIYLAGFIDGDGCIMAQLVSRRDYKFKYQIRFTVQITQLKKRKWFLERIKEILGAGYIRDRKLISDYVLVETANVANLLQQIQPFLRLKQKQANLVLKIIEQLSSSKDSQSNFLKLCLLVDQVAALNDTKKRKHTGTTVEAMLKEVKDNEVPVETLS